MVLLCIGKGRGTSHAATACPLCWIALLLLWFQSTFCILTSIIENCAHVTIVHFILSTIMDLIDQTVPTQHSHEAAKVPNPDGNTANAPYLHTEDPWQKSCLLTLGMEPVKP
jgi:hypothetical protein